MRVGQKFNAEQFNTIYGQNQVWQVVDFINRNKNYIIYPFELRLGAIRATNTGYKPINNMADSFTSVSQIFDGKSSPLAKWEGAYVVDQPKELLGNDKLELPIGDHTNDKLHEKSGSSRKGYKTGRFVEVMFESERLGTNFSPTPDNTYVQQMYSKTYTMFSTQELSTDDYLKFWIIPDLLPNKFSNEKAPANMADPQFLYIVNNEVFRDQRTGEFAYSRITFASVQDQIAVTGMAQWQYVQLSAPGSGYAFPSVRIDEQTKSYIRDKNGQPIVDVHPIYARNIGVRFMSVESNAPIGTNTIFAVGRPKPIERKAEGNDKKAYDDWEQEQYEWDYDEQGYVKLETNEEGEQVPAKKMLGVFKKVQFNQDIWPSRHLFYWKLGAPILDYLTTRTSPTSELAFIDNVSIDMSKWGEWKNYFAGKYDPATKWNFGGGLDIKESNSFAEATESNTPKSDTIFGETTKTMLAYDFQARVNLSYLKSDYPVNQLGYTNISDPNISGSIIGQKQNLKVAELPKIQGYKEFGTGARIPDVLAFNAFALAYATELPIDKNSFLTMNYSSLPGISRLINLLYLIPGVGQVAGIIGGAVNDIVSGINPGWRISGAPYSVAPTLKSFNFFVPFKTIDLSTFKNTAGKSQVWVPLNSFDDNSPQTMNNIFNFKSVAVQWMGQLSDKIKCSDYTKANAVTRNLSTSTMTIGQTLNNGKSYTLFDPKETTAKQVTMPNGAIYNLGLTLPPEQVNLNDGQGTDDQSYIIDYITIKALGQCDFRIKFYANDPNQPYADPDELCVWVGSYSSASKFYNQPTLWTTQIRTGFEEQTDLMPPTMWPQTILPTTPIAGVTDFVSEAKGIEIKETLFETTNPAPIKMNLTKEYIAIDPIGGGEIAPIKTIADAKRLFSDIRLEISATSLTGTLQGNTGHSTSFNAGVFQLDEGSKEITMPIVNLTAQPYANFNFDGKSPTNLAWPSELSDVELHSTSKLKWDNNYPVPIILGSAYPEVDKVGSSTKRVNGQLFITSSTFLNERDFGTKVRTGTGAGERGTIRFTQVRGNVSSAYNYSQSSTKPCSYLDAHFHFTTEGGDVFLIVEFVANSVRWDQTKGDARAIPHMFGGVITPRYQGSYFREWLQQRGEILQQSERNSNSETWATIVKHNLASSETAGGAQANWYGDTSQRWFTTASMFVKTSSVWETYGSDSGNRVEISNSNWTSDFTYKMDAKITLVANK